VDSVSKTTIHRRLKKTTSSRGRERFCIPPEQRGAFVQAMEDVLEVYHLPYDPTAPGGVFARQQNSWSTMFRAPIAPRRRDPRASHDEYRRCGTGEHLF